MRNSRKYRFDLGRTSKLGFHLGGGCFVLFKEFRLVLAPLRPLRSGCCHNQTCSRLRALFDLTDIS